MENVSNLDAEDWEAEIAWEDLATVLQRPNPPPVRGTTPPPPVMITRPLVTMPTIAPGSIHVITDTYKPNYEIGPSLKRKSMK